VLIGKDNKAKASTTNGTITVDKTPKEKLDMTQKQVNEEYNVVIKESYGKDADSIGTTAYSKGFKKLIMKAVSPKIARDNQATLNQIKLVMDGFVPAKYEVATNKVVLHTRPTRAEVRKQLRGDVSKTYVGIFDSDETAVVDGVVEEALDRTMTMVAAARSNHVVLHELVHAGSVEFMRANPNHLATKRVDELFEQAKSKLSGTDINFGYWKKNKYEFLAEALSNPDMIKALVNEKPDVAMGSLSTMMDQLVDVLLRMLGKEGKALDNMHDFLVDGFVAMIEEQAGENAGTKSAELHKLLTGVAMKQKIKADLSKIVC
jgi:hypothetical protein